MKRKFSIFWWDLNLVPLSYQVQCVVTWPSTPLSSKIEWKKFPSSAGGIWTWALQVPPLHSPWNNFSALRVSGRGRCRRRAARSSSERFPETWRRPNLSRSSSGSAPSSSSASWWTLSAATEASSSSATPTGKTLAERSGNSTISKSGENSATNNHVPNPNRPSWFGRFILN